MTFKHLAIGMSVLFFVMFLWEIYDKGEPLGWFNACCWALICAGREKS